jgi:hypothetical protein
VCRQEARVPQHPSLVAIVVDEYDTAIDYYVGTLGFELLPIRSGDELR